MESWDAFLLLAAPRSTRNAVIPALSWRSWDCVMGLVLGPLHSLPSLLWPHKVLTSLHKLLTGEWCSMSMKTWASEELRDCMEEGCEMWRQDVASWRSKWEGGLVRLWGEVEDDDSRSAQRWEIVLEVCIPWEGREGRMRRNCKIVIYWLKDWTDNFAIK